MSGLRFDRAGLVSEALASDRVFRGLEDLCLCIGARPSGSEAYAHAVAWAQNRLTEDGLEGVHCEELQVPHWQREDEWAEILTPATRPLPILGLSLSIPTPREGLSAEIVVVGSLDELAGLPEAGVSGRIVVFDASTSDWEAWVRLRVNGASAAGRRGAVAALVRSFATECAQTLRTGTVVYEFGVPKIPVAAITAEDAEALHGLGTGVRVHLRMHCRQMPETCSQNVIGEIPGQGRPEEIVLLHAHLDSLDVGQGALDNGAGCLMVLEAARLVGRLKAKPRRTLRVLLSAGGVTGAQGMKAYLERHRAELDRHVALIEVDGGSGPGRGFLWAPARIADHKRTVPLDLEGLRASLEPLGASRITEALWGWDTESITQMGVPAMLLDQDSASYLDVLHSSKDSIAEVRDEALRRNAAILALAAYFLTALPDLRS